MTTGGLQTVSWATLAVHSTLRGLMLKKNKSISRLGKRRSSNKNENPLRRSIALRRLEGSAQTRGRLKGLKSSWRAMGLTVRLGFQRALLPRSPSYRLDLIVTYRGETSLRHTLIN
jgi:hypothetical protein